MSPHVQKLREHVPTSVRPMFVRCCINFAVLFALKLYKNWTKCKKIMAECLPFKRENSFLRISFRFPGYLIFLPGQIPLLGEFGVPWKTS